jgi:oligoendopeptidase F
MIRRLMPFALLMLACLPAVPGALAAERSEVPARYKWDLTDLYASDAAWDEAKAAIEKRIPEVEKLSGTLGGSAAALHTGLSTLMDLQRDLQRLYTYASQKSDEDTRVSKYAEMRDNAGQLFVKLGAASAYVRPELLTIGAEKINGFVKGEPRLAPYKPYLDDVLRYAPHTLSASEEAIVAQAGRMAGAGHNVRNILNNAELPWPTITLANGEKIRLDDAAYTQYRQAAGRADRDSVFRAFWKAHVDFQNTYGAMVNAGLQDHVFNKEVRKFGSCLEASLFGDNIPPRVYTQLMADVNANLPTLHRYLRLRQRMMGLDKLRYEDLYAPIVKEVSMTYTPEQAMDITLAAVAPLGEAYVTTMRRSFQEGWIDWMPSTGKASGAYSTGAYGVHPYQLQNFTGLYDEVGTLAHESGHSLHTYFSSTNQPFVTSNYATFVAEVASTLNENLLFHHMLDQTKDRPTRLFLLGSYLDNLRATLFRQTMFAEFELAIHERAEKGETLSGETMTGMYLDLVRKYYGHDQGVCEVDSLYGVEWTYIPHFFYNFYVYQYATSLVASTALANGIHEERRAKRKSTAKRDAYLRLLGAGSSKYPIDLLKDAGVDMTTSAPFQAAIQEMNAVIDEIEKLLAAK